jgi:transposase-like protein
LEGSTHEQKTPQTHLRHQIVQLARRGLSLRAVARRLGIALRTVQRWYRRAKGQRLDRIDWADQPKTPRRTRRVSLSIEDLVLDLRRFLQQSSDLGEFGAAAIHRELLARDCPDPPSVRTIGRILWRRGALDYRRRIRRPPPPLGWYLPDLAQRRAEADAYDVVEGLVIKGGPEIQVLNGISLHGHLVTSWPRQSIRASNTLEFLLEHWRQFGLPTYAQFDNDTRFQGPHLYPDSLGRVIRACLTLQVVPVFTPPRETGFQAAIESFNGRWQAKVWARFQHTSLRALQQRSELYIAAARQRHAPRTEAAPARRPFPLDWKLDLQQRPQGRLVFLRRSNDQGVVDLLGHSFIADRRWARRLVRAEFNLTHDRIRIFALRRSQPQVQPLLSEHPYQFPNATFKEKPWRTPE